MRTTSVAISKPAPGDIHPCATTSYTDAELFEGVATGDARIARELYRRLLPVVESAICHVFGRREPNHEDLVQSSFEQIVSTLAKRRFAQACSLATWATRISANIALKALRTRCRERNMWDQRDAEDMLTRYASSVSDVEELVSSRRGLDRLRHRLAELPAAQAEAVVLHELWGHSITEMTTITGASVAAVQSRLIRGRRTLQARFATDDQAEATADVVSCSRWPLELAEASGS